MATVSIPYESNIHSVNIRIAGDWSNCSISEHPPFQAHFYNKQSSDYQDVLVRIWYDFRLFWIPFFKQQVMQLQLYQSDFDIMFGLFKIPFCNRPTLYYIDVISSDAILSPQMPFYHTKLWPGCLKGLHSSWEPMYNDTELAGIWWPNLRTLTTRKLDGN